MTGKTVVRIDSVCTPVIFFLPSSSAAPPRPVFAFAKFDFLAETFASGTFDRDRRPSIIHGRFEIRLSVFNYYYTIVAGPRKYRNITKRANAIAPDNRIYYNKKKKIIMPPNYAQYFICSVRLQSFFFFFFKAIVKLH